MKKRSLFAAVAMLIVSAIVLTSATYAWFASSAKATMETISATIENDQGGILLSTTGADNTWKSALTTSDFTTVASQLTPVSMKLNSTTGNPTFRNGTLAGTAFNCTGSASTNDYITYDVYVWAQAAGTLNVTSTFGWGGLDFIYGYVNVDTVETTPSRIGTPVFLSKVGDGYYPIIATGSATDTGDGIISSTEGGAMVDTNAESGSSAATSAKCVNALQMDAGDIIVIHVYQWAEGQNSKCVGTIDPATVTSQLTFNFSGDPAGTTVAGG